MPVGITMHQHTNEAEQLISVERNAAVRHGTKSKDPSSTRLNNALRDHLFQVPRVTAPHFERHLNLQTSRFSFRVTLQFAKFHRRTKRFFTANCGLLQEKLSGGSSDERQLCAWLPLVHCFFPPLSLPFSFSPRCTISTASWGEELTDWVALWVIPRGLF